MSTPTVPETPKTHLFNFTYLAQIGTNPVLQDRVEQVVALTVDEALAKFRAAFSTEEVKQIHRAGTVTA